MISKKVANLKDFKAIALGVLAFVIFVPVFSFSSSKNDIYVDKDATGSEDGSSAHPYNTIEEAMDHSDEDSKIHVAKGEYKENIHISKGVELYGSDEDDVIIKAKDDDKPAVIMYHKSKINKVTVKGGKQGILVDDGAKASIVKCIIKDADKDGIKIENGPVEDKRMVSISDSIIKNNGRSGIYSQIRRLSITDNTIRDNKDDGINIEKGSSAWISGNQIRNNSKSGLKLSIDKSYIWTKNNTIKNNKREGIEVSFSGESGRVNVAKSKIENNNRFGVAKVQRFGSFADITNWNKNLTFDDRNSITGNGLGQISDIFLAK